MLTFVYLDVFFPTWLGGGGGGGGAGNPLLGMLLTTTSKCEARRVTFQGWCGSSSGCGSGDINSASA